MKKNKILTREEYKEKCKKLSIAAIISMAFNILMLLLIILSCVFGGKKPNQVNAETETRQVLKHNAINDTDKKYVLGGYFSNSMQIYDASRYDDLIYSKIDVDLDKQLQSNLIVEFANAFLGRVAPHWEQGEAIVPQLYSNPPVLTSINSINDKQFNVVGGRYYIGQSETSAPLIGHLDLLYYYYDSNINLYDKVAWVSIEFTGTANFEWRDYRVYLPTNDDNLNITWDNEEFIYPQDFALNNIGDISSLSFNHNGFTQFIGFLGDDDSYEYFLLPYYTSCFLNILTGYLDIGDNVVLASGLNPNAWFTSDLSSGFIPNININTDTYLFENHLFTINGSFYDSIYVTSTPVNAINYKSVGSDKEYSFQSASYNDYRYVMYMGAKDSRGVNPNIVLMSANWYDRYSNQQFIGKGLYINSFSWVSDTYRTLQFYSDIDNSFTDYKTTLPVGGSYDIKTILNFNNSLGNSTLINGGVGGSVGNVFTLVGGAFTGVLPILGMQLLPGITIGTLLFIPLVAILVFAIIKIIKK